MKRIIKQNIDIIKKNNNITNENIYLTPIIMTNQDYIKLYNIDSIDDINDMLLKIKNDVANLSYQMKIIYNIIIIYILIEFNILKKNSNKLLFLLNNYFKTVLITIQGYFIIDDDVESLIKKNLTNFFSYNETDISISKIEKLFIDIYNDLNKAYINNKNVSK